MKTYAIIHSSHPCTELVLDVNKIKGYLARAGYSEIEDASSADLVIISTCAFNQDYEDDAVASIERIKRTAKAGAQVIVTGCLSKINPERFNRVCSYEPLAPREMNRIEHLVPCDVSIDDIEANTISLEEYESSALFMKGIRLKKFFRALPFVNVPSWLDTVPMTDWFFVRGATGCTGTCSYCAIKKARGSVRSTAPELVISQIESAVKEGYREISLAGDDMGCYGVDIGTDLPYLLGEILKIPGEFSVNLRFVEPTYLIRYLDRLMPIFDTGRITCFCVPLQSGSQRILKAMNKDFEIDEAVDAINKVLRQSRVRSISSNVMVGFPGESTADFELSYHLMDRCDIDLYQVLKYQGRPGTPSEKMDGKVDESIKEKRRARFITKMKLLKFAGLPAGLAEKITAFRHGGLV